MKHHVSRRQYFGRHDTMSEDTYKVIANVDLSLIELENIPGFFEIQPKKKNSKGRGEQEKESMGIKEIGG